MAFGKTVTVFTERAVRRQRKFDLSITSTAADQLLDELVRLLATIEAREHAIEKVADAAGDGGHDQPTSHDNYKRRSRARSPPRR